MAAFIGFSCYADVYNEFIAMYILTNEHTANIKITEIAILVLCSSYLCIYCPNPVL